MKTAALVLAAGRSRRFGNDNKLLAPLRGKPLVRHIADAVLAATVDLRIAVVSDEDVSGQLEEFILVRQDDPLAGQADNLRLGVAKARDCKADRLLVCLGDMPNVTTQMLRAIVDLSSKWAPSASCDGLNRMPPACFPAGMFDDLLSLEGDKGAGQLLRRLSKEQVIEWPRSELADVDTQEALALLQERGG